MVTVEHATAVVTGGGSGIGRATARLLAADGARVAVLDRDLAGAEATVEMIRAEGGESLAVQADVSLAEEVEQARRATKAGPLSFPVQPARHTDRYST